MKETNAILSILGIKKGEIKLITLPFIYSFFAGVSLAFFVTSATSLFLSAFERNDLSIAFILAGVLVLLTGRIYSYFQKRHSFIKVLSGGLGIFLISIIAFIFFFYTTNPLYIIFILYAWIRVFAYIHAVTFWGLLARMFSLQQAKRLFGLITGGEVIAGIISFFSVPFLLLFLKTEDLLIISGISLFFAFLTIILTVYKFKNKLADKPKKEEKVKKETTEVEDFSIKKYYKLFFIIAFLPILAQFFVDFIFQVQAKIEFPQRESLTAFVGIFFGVSSIIEFILKTFLSGKLMSRYGIRLGLYSFPIVLGISFALASGFGLIYGAISLFFSFTALGRLFTRAVRTALYDPATQILYQPLPIEQRLAFQNKIESGPKAYASIAAGVILFALSAIPWFTLVHFSIFLLIIIAFWLKSVIDIYAEYKNVLKNVLQTQVTTKEKHENLLTIIKNKEFLSSPKTKILLKTITKHLIPFNINNDDVNEEKLSLNEIISYSYSMDANKRRISAKLFKNYKIYKVERHLARLLSDKDFDVRCRALISAGEMKEPELFHHILANLRIKEYSDIAYITILNIGEKILDSLSALFQKIEYETENQIKIINVFKKIDSPKSIKFLRKWINHPVPIISYKIISALGSLNYNANEKETIIIDQKIKADINAYIYIISSIWDLHENSKCNNLLLLFEQEKDTKKKEIFTLLSAIYDSNAINLIYENLVSSDTSSKGFALEIADYILSEIHKKTLLPIIEDISYTELYRLHKQDYSMEKLSVYDRLTDIINSDINTCGAFIKVEALILMSQHSDIDNLKLLKSNIVHPNIMVQETAALAIYNSFNNNFEEIIELYKNLSPNIIELKNKINIESEKRSFMILEKIKILKSLEIFNDVNNKSLLKFSKNAKEIILKQDEELVINTNNKYNIYIIVFGELHDKTNNKKINEGEIIRFNELANQDEQKYIVTEQVLMLETQLYLFNNLINTNSTFSKKYFDTLQCS